MGNGKKNKKNEEMEKTKQYKVKAESKKSKNKTKNKKKNDDDTKVVDTTGKKQKKVKKQKKHKILKRIILFFFLAIIIACLVVAGVIAGIFFSDKYKVTEEDFAIEKINSQVLDKDGNVIATLTGEENRKVISMDEMPSYLPKAFVAIEDERFYEHQGIDILRTGKATVTYILSGGDSSFGGSTITQQLIKNVFNDDERDGVAGVERKIREMARAYNTEKILSKSQILETYLNYIYMGGYYDSVDIMGVESGAQYYFSKPAKDLSLAESAFLAGINNTPNSYYPFSTETDNSELIKTRTKTVLGKMLELREKLEIEFTDEEYEAAIAEVDNGLAFTKGNFTSTSYSYLVAAAINQAATDLAEKEGITYNTAKSRICGSGYTIYTTQDTAIQTRMEEEFAKDKYIHTSTEKKSDGTLLNEGHTQAAMVIIEPTTGQVVGTMGGLGTDINTLGLNRATQAKKKPGSSIKPLACIAPGLENGVITAATVFYDGPTNFGGSYSPHNSDYGYDGLLTVRHAIEVSSNIVNIKIIRKVGVENSIEFLSKVGITADVNDLTLALGTTSTNPLEMAAAYAMIANDGVYIEPTFYTKIVNSDGETILEPEQESSRVMSVENAYILKSILTTPVTGNGGTARVCAISGMDVAAKTGSTDSYKERWLCGFTPYYAAATWYGYDNEAKTGLSTNNAANIWAAIMKDVHSSLENKRFEKPANVVSARICLDSGCVATSSCTRTETEYFVKGTVPSACSGHVTLTICKDTGKIANEYCTNTEEKTYLEKPVMEDTSAWTTNYGDAFEDPPTETCTEHTAPTVQEVDMVDVVGKTVTNARTTLEDLGLKVEIKYDEDKSKSDGIVLKQSVAKGTKVEKGKTITLTVNKKVTIQDPDDDDDNKNTVTNTTNTTSTNTTNTGNTVD